MSYLPNYDFPNIPDAAGLKSDSSDSINPLEAYSLERLSRLREFVDAEAERLAGAPYSSLLPEGEETSNDDGEGQDGSGGPDDRRGNG